MWRDTRNLMDPFVHPGTDIVCVVGIGFNTIRKVVLTKNALIDQKYPKSLRRRRRQTMNRRRSRVRPWRKASAQRTGTRSAGRNFKLRLPKTNELYESLFNRTAYYNDPMDQPKNLKSRYEEVSSIEGQPRNSKSTQRILDLLKGKFNTMFRNLLEIGDMLFRGFSSQGVRRMRDGIFNSRRFDYYLHVIESVLSPELPKRAYDVKRGRYIFFSEGDSFVNIESGLKCLDWYSDSPKAKHEFYFDLINDSHLGMLRNKPSIMYYTKLILAIK